MVVEDEEDIRMLVRFRFERSRRSTSTARPLTSKLRSPKEDLTPSAGNDANRHALGEVLACQIDWRRRR